MRDYRNFFWKSVVEYFFRVGIMFYGILLPHRCSEILLARCLAHVRRKFENSFKASNEKSAEKILFTTKKLYDVEKKIRIHDCYKNGNFMEIVKIRQREPKPLMDHLYNQILEESKNPTV